MAGGAIAVPPEIGAADGVRLADELLAQRSACRPGCRVFQWASRVPVGRV